LVDRLRLLLMMMMMMLPLVVRQQGWQGGCSSGRARPVRPGGRW